MPSVAFDILQQFGFIHTIVERDIVKFQLAFHVMQDERILFFEDIRAADR